MARNFFLNERHEFLPREKEGGGSPPNLGKVAWATKATRIREGFVRVREAVRRSADPTATSHVILEVVPDKIPRFKKAEGRIENFDEEVLFSGARSNDIARLGLDLLQVAGDGRALLHAKPEVFNQLERTAAVLERENPRNKNRWLAIKDLNPATDEWRLDSIWLSSLKPQISTDTIIELQPVLDRVSSERVLQEIVKVIGNESRLDAFGVDFSGRNWVKLKLTKTLIRALAGRFQAIQLLHAPFGTGLAPYNSIHPSKIVTITTTPPARLPEAVVGLLDTGVAPQHAILNPYKLFSGWRSQNAAQPGYSNHPAGVASRIVFGEIKPGAAVTGDTAFYDIAVGILQNSPPGKLQLDDKDVLPSLTGARGATGIVRTFVLPFDTKPTAQLTESERLEKLRLVRDLDNFIAANDVVVVLAAGNLDPNTPLNGYPGDLDMPERQLGPWASAHNALTCGAFARVGDSALAQVDRAPSPFTRLGPGLAEAHAVPEAIDHGGGEQGGAIVLTDNGSWISSNGTSYAAPLLARKVAHTFRLLQPHVAGGENVSSSLVKAFLALTATDVSKSLPKSLKKLAKRASSFGEMSFERLSNPDSHRPLLLWQGVIPNVETIVQVLLPLPKKWAEKAITPKLRIVTSWNTIVNDAAHSVWACRRVETSVKVGPEKNDAGVHPGHLKLGPTYPLTERHFDLHKVLEKHSVDGDGLVVCLAYKTADMAPLPVTVAAAPEQSVSFVAEYWDGSGSESPYQELVALETKVGAMDRLKAAVVQAPLTIRTR